MIDVSNISRSFGSIRAVDSVCLQINAGEAFGLLGPNGAGKTTTLSMMVGMLKPDSGTVRVGGADPAEASARESIGIAPQSLSLYEELSAQENLKFLGQLYGFSGTRLKERIDWSLEFASLTDRRGSLVRTFSGGMKRRLNMAAALIHDPKVILFDEPTVGVDPQSRNHIFDCIEQLKRDGRTVIYTTHYMEEAERLCDRVGIMDQGRILAMDTVDSLLKQHGGESVVEGELDPDCETSACPGIQDDRKFQFRSQNPLRDVMKVSESGVTFRSVQIREPDLESVFLSLTGRNLRDA
ncbi:MAG: ABC transporter ATP-binding protein [Planctomycetaceae bacterium]